MKRAFYLDNDVDVTCASTIRDAGHTAWTSREAGRQEALDDEQTVYATDHDAILITHDREFTNRRKKQPIGHHVRLVCQQFDGPELLETAIERVSELLDASPNLVIEIRPGKDGTGELKTWFGTEPNNS